MSAALRCHADDGFTQWLAESGGTLLVSAYDANAVLSLGFRRDRIHLLARRFDKPMGLAWAGGRLALASRFAITEFANDTALAHDYDTTTPGRYDALYLPRTTHHCNDLNVHELAFDGGGLVFANTRFSCLARPAAQASFEACWRPQWISALAPEDRCHLNGIAVRDGAPAYVTVFADSDGPAGWRPRKLDGGAVISVADHRVVAAGLCMPHSPRWHRDRLWVLNSGAGTLEEVDTGSAVTRTVSRFDGYTRGLALAGEVALVGLSRVRERHIFSGLPIAAGGRPLRCGVAAVDLSSGGALGMLSFEGPVGEIFDVCFVPGARALNLLQADDARTHASLTTAAGSYWLRPENQAD